MPELIKQDAAKTRVLEAPYGPNPEDALHMTVLTTLPLFKMMQKPGLINRMSNVKTAAGEMDLGEILELSSEILIGIAAVDWDLTDAGAKVALNADSWSKIANDAPATAFAILTQFSQMLPEMMQGFAAATAALGKSGGGNIRLAHGRKTRTSKRRNAKR
jgi:hypothetical protein